MVDQSTKVCVLLCVSGCTNFIIKKNNFSENIGQKYQSIDRSISFEISLCLSNYKLYVYMR